MAAFFEGKLRTISIVGPNHAKVFGLIYGVTLPEKIRLKYSISDKVIAFSFGRV